MTFDQRSGHDNGLLDVLVVGAGPTGLSLAAQLQAFGCRFRIIERQLDRVHESRALAIQPRTLEVLDGFGITDQLVAHGNQTVQLRMHLKHKVLSVPLFDIGMNDTAYPYLLFLSQAETERITTEWLINAGAVVERGVELISMSQTTNNVSCALRHKDGQQEQIQARYVVGCDGAHSTVREKAGIAFSGAAYPQTFVLADVEADGIEPNAAHAFISDRGMLFFFPLSSPATWRVLGMRPRNDAPPVGQTVTIDEVQALVNAYASTPIRLHDPVWMTNFRLHNRGAAHYRAGRVFLAGDAAHIHSPAGAQGMNTGIQDAINLGWKLGLVAQGKADAQLLDTYELERAPIGKRVLRLTDRAFTAATSTNPIIRFVRTRIVPLVIPIAFSSKAFRAYGFKTVSQLGIHYRRSPISVEGPNAPRRGPKAGDRLPDAPVTFQGQPTTLHKALALDPPGYHLILCGPSTAWPAETTNGLDHYRDVLSVDYLATGENNEHGDHLFDHSQQALTKLGCGAETVAHYLIRPDGHIGYRASGNYLGGLQAYLRRWLQK